jgi:hypothetical protein
LKPWRRNEMGREDEIRTIAYHIWEDEGRGDGRDFGHWLKAEMVWEEEQKNDMAFEVTKKRSKRTAMQRRKGKAIASPDVDSTPESPHRAHRSLILKMLGE